MDGPFVSIAVSVPHILCLVTMPDQGVPAHAAWRGLYLVRKQDEDQAGFDSGYVYSHGLPG